MNATPEDFVLGTKYDVARVVLQMVYGLVRGMRFWDFTSAMQTWAWLLPVFQQVRIFSSYLSIVDYSHYTFCLYSWANFSVGAPFSCL
jgi:hypothetical protein